MVIKTGKVDILIKHHSRSPFPFHESGSPVGLQDRLLSLADRRSGVTRTVRLDSGLTFKNLFEKQEPQKELKMTESDFMAFDYKKHPAFSFQDRSYSVDLSKIATFDKEYKRIGVPSGSDGSGCQNTNKLLASIIFEVFNEMRMQARKDHERYFLDELKDATITLLNDEFYYRCMDKKKFIDQPDNKMLLALKSDRYFLGKLGATATTQIIDASASTLAMFRSRAAQGKLSRKDLSINCGSLVVNISNILNKEFASQGVLDSMSRYMRQNYHVGGLALEMSINTAKWWRHALDGMDPPKTLYAHLDESIYVPKAIVYLSDVNMQNGPTTCYPGIYEQLDLNALQELIGRVVAKVGNEENSKLKDYNGKEYHQAMISESFRRHFMKLPPELRFNSHFGWDVIPGSDMESHLLDCENVMTGSSGNYIVFDGGRLLHRGGLVEDGERIVLQVIFTQKPSFKQKIASFPRKLASKLRRRF